MVVAVATVTVIIFQDAADQNRAPSQSLPCQAGRADLQVPGPPSLGAVAAAAARHRPPNCRAPSDDDSE